VKNVPGRAKTDKLDAVWLAKLTERGMLRASFVPPKPVRHLRDLTRARAVLTEDRSRIRQRAEKLLEDAQIKISSAVSDLFCATGRRMMQALVDGQRDPYLLADLADRRIKATRQVLVESLRGQFEEHHAFLLHTYLQTEAHLTAQIDVLTARIGQILADTPAYPKGHDGVAGSGQSLADLAARLDEVPGIGPGTAQALLAELGWDMSVFPTADHLASWAKLAPRTIQSGGRQSNGRTGKGNRYLKGSLGEAALAAAHTKNSFFHARYQRIVKHRGKKKALVAVARSLLIVAWNLINDPDARYQDLGHDWHDRINPERKTLNLVAQLRALGHDVTLNPREDLAAQPA
jgi:transposase